MAAVQRASFPYLPQPPPPTASPPPSNWAFSIDEFYIDGTRLLTWRDLFPIVPPRGHVPRGDDDDDLSGAAEHASRNAGGSGDRDLFSSVLGKFVGNKSQLADEEIDEQGRHIPRPNDAHTHTHTHTCIQG